MSRSTISTFKLFEMFPDEESACRYLESRLWPAGVQCPECKHMDRITRRLHGFYRCNACKLDFTVRTGTIFERSHVPLHKWVYAMYLLVTARKGISSMQLSKEIGAELHHIPSQKCTVGEIDAVMGQCARAPYAFFGSDAGPRAWHLVLIDEADQMSNAAQLALLSRLDSTAFPVKTVFIFTCNDTGRLEPRFLSRCRVMEFSTYGMRSETASLLAQVWASETGNAQPLPNFERIAKESNNNVRESLMKLELEILAVS